jgi:tRNA-dihydrouridine synthase A
VVIVHARKAWLKGLSPKENRTIPPLDYDLVARMAAARPALRIILNGGIGGLDEAERELPRFAGVMLGRAAYERPYLLAEADSRLFGDAPRAPSRLETVRAVAAEAERTGTPVWRYARHMLGLYAGIPGAKAWRRRLTEEVRTAGPEALVAAAEAMEPLAGAA